MRCTTGRPSLRGRAPGSPSRSTSRSSTTDGDCTRPWATAPHSKRSPTTELRRPPQRDQPEDLSKILDTAHPRPAPDDEDVGLTALDHGDGTLDLASLPEPPAGVQVLDRAG